MAQQPSFRNPFNPPETSIDRSGDLLGSSVGIAGNETMSFKYFVDEHDVSKGAYFQESRFVGLFRRIVRWFIVIAIVALGLAIITDMVVLGNVPNRPNPWLVGIAAGICIEFVLVVGTPWGRNLILRIRMRRIIRSNPGDYLGDVTLTVSPDCLRTVTANGESLRKWNSVSSVEVTSTHIFILCGAMVVQRIRRDAFETDDQEEKFTALARHYSQFAKENEPERF